LKRRLSSRRKQASVPITSAMRNICLLSPRPSHLTPPRSTTSNRPSHEPHDPTSVNQGAEVTESSTNKQHHLYLSVLRPRTPPCPPLDELALVRRLYDRRSGQALAVSYGHTRTRKDAHLWTRCACRACIRPWLQESAVAKPSLDSSIDMYNNDVGKRFMK